MVRQENPAYFLVCERSLTSSTGGHTRPYPSNYVIAEILRSDYLIRPCECGGSIIHIVDHTDLEVLLLCSSLFQIWPLLQASIPQMFTQKQRQVVIIAHCLAVDICSRIGMDALSEGGHMLWMQKWLLLCLGAVSPASSGLAGGAFMLLRLANRVAEAFDMRESAPIPSSKVHQGIVRKS